MNLRESILESIRLLDETGEAKHCEELAAYAQKLIWADSLVMCDVKVTLGESTKDKIVLSVCTCHQEKELKFSHHMMEILPTGELLVIPMDEKADEAFRQKLIAKISGEVSKAVEA